MTRLRLIEQTPVSPAYLAHYLHWLWDCRYFESICSNHVNQASVSGRRLLQVGVAFPGRNQQDRIVAIIEEHLSHLDAADALLRSAKHRLHAAQSQSLDLIFASSGSPVPLGSLLQGITAGKSFGSASAPASRDEWGILKVSSMTSGVFRETENKAVTDGDPNPSYEVRAGDLLLSRANTAALVGASALVPSAVRPRLLLSDKSLRLTPRPGIEVEWLWRCLQAPATRVQISARATGTKESMRNISQAALRGVTIRYVEPPSQMRALSRFQEASTAFDRATEAAMTSERRAGALRRAILSAAFTGKLTGRGADEAVIEETAAHLAGA